VLENFPVLVNEKIWRVRWRVRKIKRRDEWEVRGKSLCLLRTSTVKRFKKANETCFESSLVVIVLLV
jgi:hypothetical protein